MSIFLHVFNACWRQVQYRSWAKCFSLVGGGGGGCNLPSETWGGPRKNPWKFLKFSFLKSLQTHLILKTSSHIWGNSSVITFFLHFPIIIGGEGTHGPSPSYGTEVPCKQRSFISWGMGMINDMYRGTYGRSLSKPVRRQGRSSNLTPQPRW